MSEEMLNEEIMVESLQEAAEVLTEPKQEAAETSAKQKQEAAFMGKPYSAVVFNFGPGEENHYIIDEYLFLELIDHLNSLEENI